MKQTQQNYKNICNQRIAEATSSILNLFKSGNIPQTVALLTNPSFNVPSKSWSLKNRLIAFANGTLDARGFLMWKTANRYLKQGSRAFYILAPLLIKDKEEEDKYKLLGFRPIPVFRAEDTEGQALEYENLPVPEFKFMDVARSWGLNIKGIGLVSNYYGAYNSKEKIILMASPEEEVFYHELAHAAHDKLGLLRSRTLKQKEIIAEFVSATLVYMTNKKTDRLGNAYQYLKSYCEDKDINKEVLKLISDIEKVLNLILETEKLIKSEIEVLCLA